MSASPLRLTSSSFLLPGNSAWSELSRDRTLSFGGYGDWPAALMDPRTGALAWVLFLEDIAVQGPAGVDEIGAVIAPVIDALGARLSHATNAPTVVAWSSWRLDSPIRNARDRSPWVRLARALEDALYDLARRHPGLLLVDLDAQWAPLGIEACFDLRNWYAAHCRLSRRGLEVVSRSIAAVLGRLARPARKVLALDCDNTLWGGVVGEVGLAGLVLGQDGPGQMFAEFQRAVVALVRHGLIVCLASKNNAAEVWQVFDEHPGMALKREHIVAARIDWNDKAGNLADLAVQLNLGLDSFVFWDDNPLERERMRLLQPGVLTPELPADVAKWPALLASSDEFASFTVTDEDRRKVEQYRSGESFAAERRQAGDEAAFLRSIDLRPSVVRITAATRSRAAQLCAKTNQFNLRTVRHGEAEVVALAEGPANAVLLAQLKDRFGDHGLVALTIAVGTRDPEIAFLDTFLMSCRILGRRLEAWLLARLFEELRSKGVRWLVAEYRPTPANIVAKDFLSDHGLIPAPRLPAAERERLASACRLQESGVGSDWYAVELAGFIVPHTEPFADADAAPR